MDAERIAAIKERLSKASPGPWMVRERTEPNDVTRLDIVDEDNDHLLDVYGGSTPIEEDTGNAAFIANARQDIPDLLRALEAAQKELAQLRTIFQHDMLEDDAGIRAAYERGVEDGQKQSAGFDAWRTSVGKALTEQVMQGFGIPTSPLPPVDKAWLVPDTIPSISLNVRPLLLHPGLEPQE